MLLIVAMRIRRLRPAAVDGLPIFVFASIFSGDVIRLLASSLAAFAVVIWCLESLSLSFYSVGTWNYSVFCDADFGDLTPVCPELRSRLRLLDEWSRP